MQSRYKTILSPQRPIGVIHLKDWGKCKKYLTLFRSLYPVSFILWLSLIFPLHILSSTSDDTIPIASTIRHYLDNSREEGKSVVLMFLFILFFLLSWCSKSSSFIISFLFCAVFKHSFRVSLLVSSSRSFPFSKVILISSSFLKDIFTKYSIQAWQFF